MNGEKKMEEYKERLKQEYNDLKEKTEKISNWICKEHNDMDRTYLHLMSLQKSIMEQYLHVLEMRAQLLNLTLGDDSNANNTTNTSRK